MAIENLQRTSQEQPHSHSNLQHGKVVEHDYDGVTAKFFIPDATPTSSQPEKRYDLADIIADHRAKKIDREAGRVNSRTRLRHQTNSPLPEHVEDTGMSQVELAAEGARRYQTSLAERDARVAAAVSPPMYDTLQRRAAKKVGLEENASELVEARQNVLLTLKEKVKTLPIPFRPRR